MGRHFEYDDKTGKATITCKCGASVSIGKSRSQNRFPSDALPQLFAQRGWLVGSHPKKDRCKACQASERQRRVVERATKTVHEPIYAEFENEPRGLLMPTPPAAPNVSEVIPMTKHQLTLAADIAGDREFTKNDRRVINIRLEEVYLDESRGYSRGWNDEKVAAELKVPVAWVAEVRDANFGENKSDASEEVQILLDALTKAREQNEEMASKLEDLCERHVALSKELQALREGFKRQNDTVAMLKTDVSKVKSIAA